MYNISVPNTIAVQVLKLLNPSDPGAIDPVVSIYSKPDLDRDIAVVEEKNICEEFTGAAVERQPTAERAISPKAMCGDSEDSFTLMLSDITSSLDGELDGSDFLSDNTELCGEYQADIAQIADMSCSFRSRVAILSLVQRIKKESTESESVYLELLKDSSAEKIRYCVYNWFKFARW